MLEAIKLAKNALALYVQVKEKITISRMKIESKKRKFDKGVAELN